VGVVVVVSGSGVVWSVEGWSGFGSGSGCLVVVVVVVVVVVGC
jgi:hypothetical protein